MHVCSPTRDRSCNAAPGSDKKPSRVAQLIALLLEPGSHVGEILIELGELFLHPMVVVHA